MKHRHCRICNICKWTFVRQCVCVWVVARVCVSLCVELFACICMILARPYLQIEEVQAVELVEDVMGQGSEPAAVHVEALELLESAESSPLQPVEVRIVPQVQLLQVPHLTEGPCLNPRDVVGEQPQNLRTSRTVMIFLRSYCVKRL